ncbi:probable protein phosphatase 2C 24 isoform X2 [Actinidia eriantha]|uniref:probable protein phosphatase 2C 24 isoform X2 n=1 Tax=Actinidia eriantha TaxID=165200 RepID=UPI00259126C9|nr:probable protein phosphatase 2C 24 isoform X2 [Actinidia eriantha]
MAKICCGSVVSEGEASTPYEPSSRAARRRRMEMQRFRFGGSEGTENEEKRQKLGPPTGSVSRDCDNAFEKSETKGIMVADRTEMMSPPLLSTAIVQTVYPKFGMASICGRRRDMEDAVAVHPFFCRREHDSADELHYFGVYDGHGGSHVAMMCRDRLHEVVKEELENKEARTEWKNAMVQSFNRMDKEVISWNESVLAANCRCELQSQECDAVGSTAVVAIVTPDKIIVANCGDSRAVLCRNGKAVPLSTDHKPDRPDELNRIQAAGGRVIYWDGPRVLGVLAMSRAIGDNYLKPYVSCDPEVTVTDRTAMDDCLILASDGLWDVVSNDTACGVARTCLRGKAPALALALGSSSEERESGGENADKACSDASMLLTKLALARRTSDNVSVVVVDLRRDT